MTTRKLNPQSANRKNVKQMNGSKNHFVSRGVLRAEVASEGLVETVQFINSKLKPELKKQAIEFNEYVVADVLINGGNETLNLVSDRLKHDLRQVYTPAIKKEMEKIGKKAYHELKNIISECPSRSIEDVSKYAKFIVVKNDCAKLAVNCF